MCKAGDPNTRCSQGCLNSNRFLARRKREAVSQSGRHFISQGPLRLRGSAESGELPGKKRRDWREGCRHWGSATDRACLSFSPEPEPGLHRRVCPRSSGHDQRSGRVQNQDVQNRISAAGHAGERHGPVKQPSPGLNSSLFLL